jgi:hypothetical protein
LSIPRSFGLRGLSWTVEFLKRPANSGVSSSLATDRGPPLASAVRCRVAAAVVVVVVEPNGANDLGPAARAVAIRTVA